jgi:protein TonB
MKDRQAFDDLIFANRNKEYGAYVLRKKYPWLVLKSLIVSIIIGSLIVILPYLKVIRKSHEPVESTTMRYVSMQMDKLEPPKEEIYIPPSAPPPPAAAQPAIKYVAPVVVDTVMPTEKKAPTVADVQASPENNKDDVIVSTSASENELVGDPNGEGGDEPFIIVEVPPTFRGGNLDKFRDWVQKRVVYPQEAQDKGIQGRVYLTFVVERDGTVTNVRIAQSPDKLLSDEAEKAIQSSPKWSPGLQRGQPVRVRFSMFLNFSF